MNLADDLFDEIFHCDQSGNAAVLIDNQHHLIAFLLHFLKKIVDRLGFRHEIDRLDQGAEVVELLASLPDAQQIALVNDSFDVVEIVAEDGNTSMTFRQIK